MFSLDSLNSTLHALGLAPAPDLFDALSTAYGAPDRHYHNQAHVAQCLQALHTHSVLTEHSAEMALALWFHDAIYDSRRSDNEALSAAWARQFLRAQGASTTLLESVSDLVMATQHTSNCADADAQLLVDIDLGILGQSAEHFDHYDQAIRREYHWVAEADYRSGRAAVLRSFLARPHIYYTPTFQQRYERQARSNLARALLRLGA